MYTSLEVTQISNKKLSKRVQKVRAMRVGLVIVCVMNKESIVL